MRVSEWLAIGYFAYLFAVAVLRLPRGRRLKAAALSLAAGVAVFIPLGLPATSGEFLRDWLPAVYLLMGYWLSGLFFIQPMTAIEQRFLAVDQWLYRLGLETMVARAPRVVLELLELAYLTCFIFVPGGMILLWVTGHQAAADRYWTLVLASEYGSFGVLPWIQTRPPRSVEAAGAIDARPLAIRRLNRFVNRETSIGVNTFPSGHVAGALMTALAVSQILPAFRGPLLIAAGLITISTVVGRYHYAVDGVAGALLTVALWWLL